MIIKDFSNLNNSIKVPMSELLTLTSPSLSGEKYLVR